MFNKENLDLVLKRASFFDRQKFLGTFIALAKHSGRVLTDAYDGSYDEDAMKHFNKINDLCKKYKVEAAYIDTGEIPNDLRFFTEYFIKRASAELGSSNTNTNDYNEVEEN